MHGARRRARPARRPAGARHQPVLPVADRARAGPVAAGDPGRLAGQSGGASLEGHRAEPLFTDVEGRTCAVTVDLGPGRAVVATSELPSHPALFTAIVGWLGSAPGLRLRTSVPGVVVTTGVTPRGERMLHVLNPTGYAATIQVDIDDPTGLLSQPLAVPARTGAMLGLGLRAARWWHDRVEQCRGRRAGRGSDPIRTRSRPRYPGVVAYGPYGHRHPDPGGGRADGDHRTRRCRLGHHLFLNRTTFPEPQRTTEPRSTHVDHRSPVRRSCTPFAKRPRSIWTPYWSGWRGSAFARSSRTGCSTSPRSWPPPSPATA